MPMMPQLTSSSVMICLSLLLTLFSCGKTLSSSGNVKYLDQGFDEETRKTFYHAAQGTRLLRYSWFLALEQVTNTNRFFGEENLKRFGLFLDRNTLNNPDQLPVGFAKTVDVTDKNTYVGLTCAACHTTEISYSNQTVRIDGGPSLFNALLFAEEVSNALDALVGESSDRDKFARFAKAVLKEQWSEVEQTQLQDIVLKALNEKLKPQRVAEGSKMNLYPTEWGPGRLDALGRGGNTILFQLDRHNLRPANAPVSYPAIWSTWILSRVQWNGAVRQPMGRNLLQALGLGANLNFDSTNRQFLSSANVADLSRIEKLVQTLEPPVWPEKILGRIDQVKANRGARLYELHCAHCHVAKLTEPNESGKQFKEVNLIPLKEIGTDPLSATNFHQRTVKTGPLGFGLLSVADTAEHLTTQILQGQYKEHGISQEEQKEWNGYRPNTIEGPLAYVARPHSGVWALAPYLHNGSIPNLFQLLSPPENRENMFYVGHSEYDPKQVGFVSQKVDETDFKFVTTIPGNFNSGHEFRDGPRTNGVIGPALSDQERWDLIEYLKTL